MQETKEERIERENRQEKFKEERKKIKEELDKTNLYKNVESIKKNVQFFFWFTLVSSVLAIVFFLMS